MSARSTDRSSRKHKKAKDAPDASDGDAEQTRNSKGSGEAPGKPTVDDANAVGQQEVLAKVKKHKKRKHVEPEDGPDTRQDVESTRQKKKRKHEEGVLKREDVVVADGAEPVSEKKKRRRTEKAEAAERRIADKGEETETKKARRKKAGHEAKASEDSIDLSRPASDPTEKSKKDKKKRKKGEDSAPGDQDDGSKSKPPDLNGKSNKRKRKHRSSLGLPDPGDDESLSEQARRALQYAFTQFDDPSSWKFNKARQNWLIRNVWFDEAIPDTYMSLVSRYLQGVQGGVRETLIRSCKEAVEPSKIAGDASTAPVEGDDKPLGKADGGEGDSPTKRTVTFAVEESSTSSKPDAPQETKRQRAAMLLAVLTSNTT